MYAAIFTCSVVTMINGTSAFGVYAKQIREKKKKKKKKVKQKPKYEKSWNSFSFECYNNNRLYFLPCFVDNKYLCVRVCMLYGVLHGVNVS